MKIIISPAKKMEVCEEVFEPGGLPRLLERTRLLCDVLRGMTEPELKKLFKANDRITRENYRRYQTMELERTRSAALLSYVGIQYQYMAPKLFSYDQWEYVKDHLRILSGFYGILRPDDRVTPYRLEMQAKLSADGKKDLYEFWGESLLEELIKEEKETPVILNLASKEYSRAVEPYLTPKIRFVTCVFGVLQGGSVKVKATEAKMARGEMVRFMAENKVEAVEELRQFSRLGYRYSKEHSGEDTLVYLKDKKIMEEEE